MPAPRHQIFGFCVVAFAAVAAAAWIVVQLVPTVEAQPQPAASSVLGPGAPPAPAVLPDLFDGAKRNAPAQELPAQF